MSLSEGMIGRISKFMTAAGLLWALAVMQACTVTPLYGSRADASTSSAVAKTAQIAIKPASSREEQQVRNHLIFLLGNDGSEPSNPAYSLDLGVSTRTIKTITQQTVFDPKNNEGQPTSGTVIMTSDYVLSDTATGKEIASGERSAAADFDKPRQEFASDRAERDAQDRAARELAELLRLSLAQNLVGK